MILNSGKFTPEWPVAYADDTVISARSRRNIDLGSNWSKTTNELTYLNTTHVDLPLLLSYDFDKISTQYSFIIGIFPFTNFSRTVNVYRVAQE